jgi:hypothetical protein
MHNKLLQSRAISATVGTVILVACVAAVLALLYVGSFTFGCYCGNVKTVQLNSASFDSNSNTFDFKVTNWTNKATSVSSSIVNQTACFGNYPTIAKGETIALTCIVSGASFTQGQKLLYALNFTNGDSINGELVAK